MRASLLALLACAAPALADETPVKGKIVAADLFKNGLVVVRAEVALGGPGTYVLDEVPQPVHGTFWVESTGKVEAVMKMRDVELPAAETPPGNPQEDFAGRKVTIHFRGEKLPPVVGTMAKLKPAKRDEAAAVLYGGVPQASRYLVIQTAGGRSYVDATEVATIETGEAGTVKRRQPRMLLTLGPTDAANTAVTVRYVARGLAWAPSYRIDITDPKTLTIEQHAVVRNELADLDGTDVRLISGYPSVQFSRVTSPLSARTSWATFFQELSNRGGWDADVLSNSIMSQQVVMRNPASPNFALGAIPTGEGVDLHYQSIGKRTLAEGEALALTIASGKAGYERIVEWLVPDTRDENGHHVGDRRRGGGSSSDDDDETAWDALRFKNPLAFPMTTGPVTVTAGGNFNGQRTSHWVNAGEETVLRVNKALSVRTRATEYEEQRPDARDEVWVGGRRYRKVAVAGELAMSNHRKETIQLVVRRRFSGELVESVGDPKLLLREEGVYSVNKRSELLWTLPLKAGEERTLKYRYTVLVHY